MTAKTYKSEALASIHQMMEGAQEVGAIDKKTMQEFDDSCLTDAPLLRPDEIKALRESEAVSQPVFARYLNVSKNLVSDWERGVKKPGGPALRLLSIVSRKGLAGIV
jgi:putative transcriptional regulator